MIWQVSEKHEVQINTSALAMVRVKPVERLVLSPFRMDNCEILLHCCYNAPCSRQSRLTYESISSRKSDRNTAFRCDDTASFNYTAELPDTIIVHSPHTRRGFPNTCCRASIQSSRETPRSCPWLSLKDFREKRWIVDRNYRFMLNDYEPTHLCLRSFPDMLRIVFLF